MTRRARPSRVVAAADGALHAQLVLVHRERALGRQDAQRVRRHGREVAADNHRRREHSPHREVRVGLGDAEAFVSDFEHVHVVGKARLRCRGPRCVVVYQLDYSLPGRGDVPPDAVGVEQQRRLRRAAVLAGVVGVEVQRGFDALDAAAALLHHVDHLHTSMKGRSDVRYQHTNIHQRDPEQ